MWPTLSDADVARQWWQEILAEVHACAGLDPGQLVRYHHLAGKRSRLLVPRTFELWAHGDDVRQAVGKPLSLLDDARLTLMVSELMDALPAGMALTGQDLPGRSARFVLEGPGGGTFDAALSFGQSPAATPDVVITTNTIDLCRLAANRLTPGISLSTFRGTVHSYDLSFWLRVRSPLIQDTPACVRPRASLRRSST